MIERTIKIRNGDIYQDFNIYRCDCCSVEIEESSPFVRAFGKHLCGVCAFKLGIIGEKEFLKEFYYFYETDGLKVGINPKSGGVEITTAKKFSWEKSNRERRRSCEYVEWRLKVFERDGYKCQVCGKVGGVLNAHHIKSYAAHEDLRHELSNGITLCEECHKDIHRRK